MEILIYTWEERSKKKVHYNEKDTVLFNDKMYQFIIKATLEDEDLSTLEIIIEDGVTKIDYLNKTSKQIWTNFKAYFQKSFGFCQLKIGEKTINLEIQASQLLKKEANNMVDYIFKKDPYQIVSALSDSSIKTQKVSSNYFESSLKRLKQLNNFIILAGNQFEFFLNFSQSKANKKETLLDYNKANIDDKSIIWVFNNLDCIEVRNFSSGSSNSIKLGKKYGYIDKILSKTTCVNFNVYENQIILGTFDFIKTELNKIEYHFCAQFIKNKNLYPKYHSFEVLPPKISKKIQSELSLVKKNFVGVHHKYKKLFNNITPLNQPPKPSQVFTKVMHYKFLFIAIKNLRKSTLNLDGINSLLKIKNIHKLYELFNYHLILEIIIESLKGKNFKPNYQDFDHELYRKISFHNKKNTKINFYYEPEIRKNGGRLDVKNLFPVINKKEHCLTPDFVIEFTDGIEFKYLIIDAKFSNLKNINSYFLPKLSQSYALGLRKKNNPTSLIEHLILAHPNKTKIKKCNEYFNKDSPISISTVTSKVDKEEYLKEKIMNSLNIWIKESTNNLARLNY